MTTAPVTTAPAPTSVSVGPLTGQTVAVTGDLPSLSRNEAALIVEQLGGRLVASVSAKTNHLIVGTGAGSKKDKALAAGVALRDERWLLDLDVATPASAKINPDALEVIRVMAAIHKQERPTWTSRRQVDAASLVKIKAGLKASGIPVGGDDEDENVKIVCILDVSSDVPTALVLCPNHIAYFFNPGVVELDFWRFALSYYYVVTLTMADRAWAATRFGVDVKNIHGKTISRSQSAPRSDTPLGDMLLDLGCQI